MKLTQLLTLMIVSLSILTVAVGSVEATIPYYIGYQGTLHDDAGLPVPDGSYSMNFVLYDTLTGGTLQWSETQTVAVSGGIFNVKLGKVKALKLATVDQPLWLSIAIQGQTPLSPRIELTSAPYSYMAGTVRDAAIGPDQLANNTVVRGLNNRTGYLSLVAGPNITITNGTNTITIEARSGTVGDDDGDWAITGDHLSHDTTGTVSLGTGVPAPMVSGQASLQVAASLWPSIALDRISPFQRWLIINEGVGNDLVFSHTTSGNSTGTPVMTIDDDGQVGIGRLPAATLDILGGNGDVIASNGDLRIDNGSGEHQLRIGVHNSGTLAGETNIFAKSTTGTARINLGLDDHKVVAVEDNTLDFYGNGSQVQIRLEGSPVGSREGMIRLYGSETTERINIDGRNGNGASLTMRQIGSLLGVKIDSYSVGGGRIVLYDASGISSVIVDGSYNGGVGRILTPELEITGGADLSEQFDVQDDSSGGGSAPVPGTVVCIDPQSPGGLRVSSRSYDRRVAGIISGAGGVKPGLLMGQKNSVADGDYPVALTGRVYVRADASAGPIEPGDLLTTSDTPGHAMKVIDHDRANGAILGKAMTALDEGRGLVLVLVSLQ